MPVPKFSSWLLLFLCLAPALGIGFFTPRENFGLLISLYSIFFISYLLFYKNAKQLSWVYKGVIAGIIIRFILVFSMPELSDDIYRFIWDGRIWNTGFSPFNFTPLQLVNSNPIEINKIVYENLNSKNYYTIYPPTCQYIFGCATWLFPRSVSGSTIMIKLSLFLFEIGTLFFIFKLLKQFQLPKKRILLYALNPLIIIEICGNAHFEGAMIFFFLLSLWLISQQKILPSALAFSLGILAKLHPLMFLPFYIKKLNIKNSLLYFTGIGLTTLVLFAPFLSQTLAQNFSSSLDLYFRHFEYNGSIYYIFRWLGIQWKGYNWISVIGPALSFFVLLSIIFLSLKENTKNWRELMPFLLGAICLYLFCATTVHPWYLCLPIALCLFTRFRFLILWSFFIYFTYINYSYKVFQENILVVLIEYFVLYGFIFIEILYPNLLKQKRDSASGIPK